MRDYKTAVIATTPHHPKMPSQKENRLRAYNEILRYGRPVEIPCNRCFFLGHVCIVMEGSTRLKCAECRKQNNPCVNLSWESLDRTREEYRKKVEDDEHLLTEVMARLLRNRKILQQADERARRKAECLASELDAEPEELDDCPAAAATIGLSPLAWETFDSLEFQVPLNSSS